MVDLHEIDSRLKTVEEWKAEQSTNAAVRAERDKHLDKRFDRLEEGVNQVKGYLLRIVWIIVLGVIGSAITFMVNGGFSIVAI